MAEQILSRRHRYAATCFGQVFDPAEAKAAGFLQETVPTEAVLATAMERALAFTALPPDGGGATSAASPHQWGLPGRLRIEIAPAAEQAGAREKRLADAAFPSATTA